MTKGQFLKTELGEEVQECIFLLDIYMEARDKYTESTEKFRIADKRVQLLLEKWSVAQIAIRQFYGVTYNFTRTDEYFGLCTEDERNWLFKVNRRKAVRE